MFERPMDVTDLQILELVRTGWVPLADRVEYLAVGFGAHHWRAECAGISTWFVTYDRLGDRHTMASLSSAYLSAVELAECGLDFVLAPTPAQSGGVVLPLADGALSCTRWLEGEVLGSGPLTDAATARQNITDLWRMHRSEPPPHISHWKPLIGADFHARLESLIAVPWDKGPYGESARAAINDVRSAIRGWVDRYRTLCEVAVDRPWVPTHGETQTSNQLRTSDGIRFVDWESLKLAPRERDLSTLVQAGYGDEVRADPSMVELFDLEWRLCEIDSYSAWFAAPHPGSTDDRVAHGGLMGELRRGAWWVRG